ncbi:M20 aminoacylase family protein [Coralliovum pocilloporae]|uniref:M20 aminoacylase family protein n=1 Tax=Coralliovum pocilloporae TaxID=3066369 RepID=UPI0033078052
MNTVKPDDLADLIPFMTAFRHDLHAHPELGFEETRTAGKVADSLRQAGLEVHESIGGTGVVGLLRKGSGNRAIGFRADMDALPLDETGTPGYASRHPGRMHACGHDGHTSMLLGAARHLAQHGRFDGTVVFIFQPNEENGLGAQAMLNDGLFERFPVEEVYALHNLPGEPLGAISTRPGTICSSESLFEITIAARGGHSAMPHRGVDAILVGSELVQALQSIVARKLEPGSGGVVSVTEFITDGRRNVLPGTATLKGDVRARTPAERETIRDAMQRLSDGLAAAHDVSVQFSFETEFIETLNGEAPTEALAAASRSLGLTTRANREPMPFSEDFAHLSSAVPGCFALIGNGTEGANGQPLHATDYDFNDALLPIGAALWCRLAEERLNPESDHHA